MDTLIEISSKYSYTVNTELFSKAKNQLHSTTSNAVNIYIDQYEYN